MDIELLLIGNSFNGRYHKRFSSICPNFNYWSSSRRGLTDSSNH